MQEVDVHEGMVPRRHPDAAFRVVEGNGVVVLPGAGEVQLLNPSGARVWELIDGSRSVGEISRALAEEFDISQETARADTEAFIRNLARQGMLAAE